MDPKKKKWLFGVSALCSLALAFLAFWCLQVSGSKGTKKSALTADTSSRGREKTSADANLERIRSIEGEIVIKKTTSEHAIRFGKDTLPMGQGMFEGQGRMAPAP